MGWGFGFEWAMVGMYDLCDVGVGGVIVEVVEACDGKTIEL